MHQEFTCYDRPPILKFFLYNRRAIQGVPPLTGDGSQFDAQLDHTDPSLLSADRHAPVPSGGRTFAVAFAIISALLIGLVAGLAGGFFIGQQAGSIAAPRSATQAVAPVPTTAAQPQTYTDAPVAEEIRESAHPQSHVVSESPVSRALSAPRGEPDKARPTGVVNPPNTLRGGPLGSATTGSLQVASRPSGAQVFVDAVRVGVTPMSLAEVSAGSHRVRIELPGFRRWATAVNVDRGLRARVGASLER